MSDILQRDRTGECEGECVDRIREGEEKRQASMSDFSVDSPDSYPDIPWARSRNDPPGVFGGHV